MGMYRGLVMGESQGLREGASLRRDREASRRADVQLGLDQASGQRAATNFQQQQEDRAAEKARTADGEGFTDLIYGAFTRQDPAALVGKFNSTGNMRLKGFTVGDDDSFTMESADGQQAYVAPHIVRAFLEKRGLRIGEPERTEAVGLAPAAPAKIENFDRASILNEFGKHYDVDATDVMTKKAIAEQAFAGVPYEDIASELDLKPRKGVDVLDLEDELAKVNERIAEHDQQLKGGGLAGGKDDRFGFLNVFSRQKDRNRLLQRKTEIEKALAAAAPPTGLRYERRSPAAAAPVKTGVDTTPASGTTAPLHGEDLNEDGRVDELEAEYRTAKHVVSLIQKNPAMRATLERKLGSKLAQAEALVKAVERQAADAAKNRVQGLGLPR